MFMWQRYLIYGFIDRQQAELLLAQESVGVFLIRPSSERGFAVSVQTLGGIKHIKITEQVLEMPPGGGTGVPPLWHILTTAEELIDCQVFYFINSPLLRTPPFNTSDMMV